MKYFNLSLTLTPVRLSASLLIILSVTLSLNVRAGAFDPVEGSKSAAKAVVNKLVAGDVEGVRADFNEEMKQGLTAEKMKEVWAAAIQYHGNFKSQGEASQSQQQGYDVYVIRCEMEKSPMDVVVAYDKSGKIGGLWLCPSAA
jgi:hypothetical protein